MQFPGQGKPASSGIAFDSDFGNGIDDVLALAMLYGFEGKSEARLISTSTTKSNLHAAAFCSALAKFYAGPPPTGLAAAFQRPAPPIGMADNGKLAEDTPIIKAVIEKKSADGKPVYANAIQKMNDTADPVALIRNSFTAEYDGNGLMFLSGPATTVARLLDYPLTPDLIKHKVKSLVFAAGTFPSGNADPKIKADVAAARRLFADWPTPIIAAGTEVGAALPFPGASIEKDFSWAPDHPVVDAYRAFHALPYDAPAPAMAGMLYAVHPEGYFKLSEPGTISVLEDGRTKFTPSADGRHRYLIEDPAQKEKIIQLYMEMASAKPTARPQRIRGPQKKDQAVPPKAGDPPKKQ